MGNNAIGISGVCWTGSVMAVKFMNFRGKGSTSDACDAIRYAVRQGAKVINASFGSSSKSNALQDAVEYAQDKGVLLVVAAGNDGEDIDKHPVYPASFGNANILTVAASTSADKLASFSNYGDEAVDVAAAGEDIVSTYLGNRYATLSGTSMAAPLVAGMAGLLRAENRTPPTRRSRPRCARRWTSPAPSRTRSSTTDEPTSRRRWTTSRPSS